MLTHSNCTKTRFLRSYVQRGFFFSTEEINVVGDEAQIQHFRVFSCLLTQKQEVLKCQNGSLECALQMQNSVSAALETSHTQKVLQLLKLMRGCSTGTTSFQVETAMKSGTTKVFTASLHLYVSNLTEQTRWNNSQVKRHWEENQSSAFTCTQVRGCPASAGLKKKELSTEGACC